MKEQYIKQVEKELSLPHKAKKEVVRDLKEFADSTAEQFGIDNASSKKGKVSFLRLLRLLLRLLPFRYMLSHD